MQNKYRYLINSQNCGMFKARRDLRRSVIHASAQAESATVSCLGPCPFRFWVSSSWRLHKLLLENLLKCSATLMGKNNKIIVCLISCILTCYHYLSLTGVDWERSGSIFFTFFQCITFLERWMLGEAVDYNDGHFHSHVCVLLIPK